MHTHEHEHEHEHESRMGPDFSFSSLVEVLRHWATTQPQDTAYTFLLNGEEEAGSLTFAELDAKARTLAVRLLADVAPGDRALLLYPSSLDYVVGFFGCLYAGIIPVPNYPPKRNKPDRRLQSIANDADPALLLCNGATLGDVEKRIHHTPELRNMHWIATDQLDGVDRSTWHEPDIDADSLAFLQYTSGSTSAPKGVMVSHGNLLQVLEECDLSWRFARGSRMVSWLPIFHDLGLIFGILQPAYNGIPSYFMTSVAFLQQPVRWLRAISKYEASHTAAPNFAYDLCVERISEEQRAALDLSHLVVSMNAAEPVRAYTMRRFAEVFAPAGFRSRAFCPAFGMAESTLKATATCRSEESVFTEVYAADLGRHWAVSPDSAKRDGVGKIGSRQTLTLVSSGHAVGTTRVVAVDPETREQCPENRVGEIWVSGPIVAKGYWNRPEETAETFGGRLVGSDEGPFLRTGDLGFIRDGECYVTGRLKDVIIIRGINHYPQDIELTVQESHPALRPDCGAAFSVEVGGEERLVVVQEVRRTFLRDADPVEISSAVRRAILDVHELQVHSIALLRTASILKTSSGKIQRQACKAHYLENQFPIVATWNLKDGGDGGEFPAAPPTGFTTDSVQHWIMQWAARRSGRDLGRINPRESFDAFGMDSLLAVEFAHDLGAWIGTEIDETIVWNYPTIETLSLFVADKIGDGKEKAQRRIPCGPTGRSDRPLDELSEDELVGLLYDEIGRSSSQG